MAQQLNAIKNKGKPKRPKSLHDINNLFNEEHIIQQYGMSLDKRHQLYHATVSTDTYGFTLFASNATIEMVKEHIPDGRIYLLDGTFKSAPTPFYQLLTISIEYKNDASIFFIFSNEYFGRYCLLSSFIKSVG